MKPIFTVHAGEYLVASFIEEKFKNYNVWIPSKDTGIDLLITNFTNKKTISVQVKFSKDWTTHTTETLQHGLKSCGWWVLNRDKLSKSPADFWIFVLYGLSQESMQYVIIRPKELLKKLTSIHGGIKMIQTYLWVTTKDKCWETRGLKKEEQILVANHSYLNKSRDFKEYLNNWRAIERELK